MKTTFEDFEKTTLYANLLKDYKTYLEKGWYNNMSPRENFLLAIKTAFLVGHQLGMEEARDILKGEKE